MRNRPLRVLVVDDEGLIRWAVRQALTAEGYIVVEAADAASARRLTQDADQPFDVVLLDVRLPDSSDFTLLEDFRRLSPTSTVMLMTAYGDPVLTAAARRLGARYVIDKPFDVIALAAQVREAVPIAA